MTFKPLNRLGLENMTKAPKAPSKSKEQIKQEREEKALKREAAKAAAAQQSPIIKEEEAPLEGGPTPEKRVIKRRTEKTYKVWHDLFKLKLANTRKNVQIHEDMDAIWEKVPHQHFYHTADSSGRILTHSASTAGHSHQVFIEKNEEGEIVDYQCGPPQVMSKGKWCGYKNDKHVHDLDYILSEVVEGRVKNQAAQEHMAMGNKEEAEAFNNAKGIVK